MNDNEYVVCPNCHNPNCDATHDYCWNCGIELGNCCENPECPAAGLTDNDHGVLDLPDNFSFCPYCGQPTRYKAGGYIQQLEFDP